MSLLKDTKKERAEEAREDRAEAAEHRRDAEKHRREAAEDRREAARDRAENDPLEAAGNKVEAKGHDLAAGLHEKAAAHDEREAAREGAGGTAAPRVGSAAATGAGATGSDDLVAGSAGTSTGNGHLFPDEQCRRLQSRWDSIQASFIDEPRDSVRKADALVRETTEALHDVFERDRRQLEGVWDRGDEASTEDLRVTLQRYRSFFERLLRV